MSYILSTVSKYYILYSEKEKKKKKKVCPQGNKYPNTEVDL